MRIIYRALRGNRKSVIAAVRALRKRYKTLADMPPEVIAHLDAIIVILKTA